MKDRKNHEVLYFMACPRRQTRSGVEIDIPSKYNLYESLMEEQEMVTEGTWETRDSLRIHFRHLASWEKVCSVLATPRPSHGYAAR